jgi:anti-sigma-K factor RskA
MSLSPEDDFAAAEFALGTLDPAERATIAARRLREPEMEAAICAWEERLAPLAEIVPPIEPPRDYLADIQARLRSSAPLEAVATRIKSPLAEDPVATLKSRVARWRAAAIGAASLAAMLAIGFVAREATRQTAPREYVAVLQKDPSSPAFAVTVNLDTRQMTVRPVSAPTPSGKSYELWIINKEKLGSPRSLGVIDAGDITRADKLATFDRAVVADATYAVTIEPPGGSPDGNPSGPPVWLGKLIPVGP